MAKKIEEIIKSEQEIADFHQKISQMASSPKNKTEAQQYSDYHSQIIDIMKKYQKIEQIVADRRGKLVLDTLVAIIKVVEDGNVN